MNFRLNSRRKSAFFIFIVFTAKELSILAIYDTQFPSAVWADMLTAAMNPMMIKKSLFTMSFVFAEILPKGRCMQRLDDLSVA